MEIELYIGYANNTWDVQTVEIPDDTPTYEISEVAQGYGELKFFNNANTKDEVVFVTPCD